VVVDVGADDGEVDAAGAGEQVGHHRVLGVVALPRIAEQDEGGAVGRADAEHEVAVLRRGERPLPRHADPRRAGLVGRVVQPAGDDVVAGAPQDRRADPRQRARVGGHVRRQATRTPGGRGFHRLVSEFFDWNDPPLFKSFLRVDVRAGALRVRCYGVSGCAEAEGRAPVEDDWTVALS